MTSLRREGIYQKASETSPMATKSRVHVFKIKKKFKKNAENYLFWGTSILELFFVDFGRFLGPKNQRFSVFFLYFLKVKKKESSRSVEHYEKSLFFSEVQ